MKTIIYFLIFIFFAVNLQAQIIYTHPNPELEFGYNSYGNIYPSGSEEARIVFTIRPIDSNQDSVKFQANLYNYTYYLEDPTSETAAPLNWGNEINPYSKWQWISEWDQSTTILSTRKGTTNTGLWANAESKFFGFRCIENTDTTYGWIRLSINNEETQMEILDYAYNSVPNQGLYAGEGLPFCVQNLYAFDASDCNDETDIVLQFEIPAIEDSISEYRVLIIPSSISESFDLEQAENISEENYLQIIPNEENYLNKIPSGTLDIEGNEIIAIHHTKYLF
jgi:hypothetical protein